MTDRHFAVGYECEHCHRPIKVTRYRGGNKRVKLACPYCRHRGKMNKRVKVQRFFHPRPLTEVFEVISGLGDKGTINEVIREWAIANVRDCQNPRYFKRLKRVEGAWGSVMVCCHEVPEEEKCDWCKGLIQNIPLSRGDLKQMAQEGRARMAYEGFMGNPECAPR